MHLLFDVTTLRPLSAPSERAAMAGGLDTRAGRPQVRTLLPLWLAERPHSVSAKTYIADAAVPRPAADRSCGPVDRRRDRP